MSSLEETPGPEMGVSDQGDIQNVQCWVGAQDQGWKTLIKSKTEIYKDLYH